MRLTAASSCNASLPITCTGVSSEGAVLFSEGDAGILYTRDTGTKTVAASTVFEVENDVLKPSYDAAHVALKGLWRLPTKEEFSLLVTGTTNSFADGGMTFSGA